MIIKDIVDFNPSAKQKVHDLPFINYLDTSSVTEGSIENIDCLYSNYPSRAQRIINDGDIFISSVRPNLLHNCQVDHVIENMVASTGFIQIRTKSDAFDAKYLYYYLTQPRFISKYIKIADTSQSAYPSFNKDIIEELPVPTLSLTSQHKIALALSSLDRRIALARRKIKTLETMAKEIYDYWFVQYDFPDENGRPYKSSGGKMVYSDELKREIPEGWKCGSLRDVMTLSRRVVNPQKIDGLVAHYSIPAYDSGQYPLLEEASSIESSKFRIDENSIMLSKLNPKFKRIWDPPLLCSNNLCSSEFMVCQSNVPRRKGFLYFLLNSDSIQKYMVDGSSSSTGSRSRFTPENILTYPLSLATGCILDQYSLIANNTLTEIRLCRRLIEKLIKLREFLLPLLMNGQVELQ